MFSLYCDGRLMLAGYQSLADAKRVRRELQGFGLGRITIRSRGA